jgi:membrane protein DedA with SNARE-associated domain
MSFELFLGLLVQYGYWMVFAGILLDNAGLPLPGELLLLTLGAMAGTGHVDPGLAILVATAAAMSGDSVGYWLGRLGGDRVIRVYCRVTLGSGRCVENAIGSYHRRGKVAIILGRFVIGVRAFLFPLAGSARMPYAQFLLFDSVGALVWAGVFILAGYSVGWRVSEVIQQYRLGAIVLAGALGASFTLYLLMKLCRRWRHGPGSLREQTVTRLRRVFGWA